MQGPLNGLVKTAGSGIFEDSVQHPEGVELTNQEAVDGILTTTQLATAPLNTYLRTSDIASDALTVLPSGVVFLTSTLLDTYLMVDDVVNGVPADALLNNSFNQAAVGAILTTDLLDGYLTAANLPTVTNHLGTRDSFTARPTAGFDTVWTAIESLSGSDAGQTTMLALALTQLGLRPLKPRFYQTTNSYDNKVSNEPQGELQGNDANGDQITAKLNYMGVARYASNWLVYRRWKAFNDVGTINSDTNSYEPTPGSTIGSSSMFVSVSPTDAGTTTDVEGVKCKLAGYYRATCHMHFYSNQFRAAVAVRFAVNDLVNDNENGVSENPGPIQITGSINSGGSKRNAQTVSLSHVFNLAAFDVVKVFTSKAGATAFDAVHTPAASCTFRIEYLGPSV